MRRVCCASTAPGSCPLPARATTAYRATNPSSNPPAMPPTRPQPTEPIEPAVVASPSSGSTSQSTQRRLRTSKEANSLDSTGSGTKHSKSATTSCPHRTARCCGCSERPSRTPGMDRSWWSHSKISVIWPLVSVRTTGYFSFNSVSFPKKARSARGKSLQSISTQYNEVTGPSRSAHRLQIGGCKSVRPRLC